MRKHVKYNPFQFSFGVFLNKQPSIKVRVQRSNNSLKRHINDMSQLITAQRVKILQLFYRNNNSIRTVVILSRKDYGQFNCPTRQAILSIVSKFDETGSIVDDINHIHHPGVLPAENIADMNDSVTEYPKLSILRYSDS